MSLISVVSGCARGMQGLADIIVRKAKTRRMTMLVCFACGCAIFFDGALSACCSCMLWLVSTVLRPQTTAQATMKLIANSASSGHHDCVRLMPD